MIYGSPKAKDIRLINRSLSVIDERGLQYPLLGESYNPRANLKKQVEYTKRTAEAANPANRDFNRTSDVNLHQPFADYMEEHSLKVSPHQSDYIKSILEDAASVITKEKFYWNIPRPQQVMPITVKYEAKTAKSPSYPSGHSAQGMLLAYILADLFPEHREELLEIGARTGFARIELGVHTPQDVRQGRNIAFILYNKIFT